MPAINSWLNRPKPSLRLKHFFYLGIFLILTLSVSSKISEHSNPGDQGAAVSPKTLAAEKTANTETGSVLAATDTSYQMPVLVLKYFPTQDGINLDSNTTGITSTLSAIRNKVNTIKNDTVQALEEGSRYRAYKDTQAQPALNYSIIEEKEYLQTLPIGLPVPWNPVVFRPDYRQILTNLNICNYVDNQGLKEVWLYGWHHGNIEPVESNMAGPSGDISNSERTDDMPTCSKTYVLYNYNYGRDTDTAVHNHGHQIEVVLKYFGDPPFENNFIGPWPTYGTNDGSLDQFHRCGWTHAPPNASNEYDYANTRFSWTDCENWTSDGSGQKVNINCSRWQCDEVKFHVWRWQNMPGRNNGSPNLTNWWDFIGDFDKAKTSGEGLIDLTPITPPIIPAAAPDPKPCQDPQTTTKLSDNYITDQDGNPPTANLTISDYPSFTGNVGDTITIPPRTLQYEVNFSKLQAIFANTNSNYIEGAFQDQVHNNTNVLGLIANHKLGTFTGPLQKTSPKIMLDMLKVAYIKYVYEKPSLAESANTFTNVAGANPKTISELVTEFGSPNPSSLGGWTTYWEKIPTAYNEFYEGILEFKVAAGTPAIDLVKSGDSCPISVDRKIKFPVPNFFRTAAVTGQQNMVIVPKAAQHENNNLILGSAQNIGHALGSIIDICFKAITQNPFANSIKKAVTTSLENLNPTKPAYAATPTDACVKIQPAGKKASAPFCAIYAQDADGNQNILPGECVDSNASGKLNDQTNVVCNFSFTYSPASDPVRLVIPATGNGQWDSCTGTNPRTCTLTVAVWPDFRIPFLCEIWNSTLYSDENENCKTGTQQTGRPGVFSAFTPQAVLKEMEKDPIQEMIDKCQASLPVTAGVPAGCNDLVNWATSAEQISKYPGIEQCVLGAMLTANLAPCVVNVARSITDRKLPGQVNSGTGPVAGAKIGPDGQVLAAGDTPDQKENYVGAVECNKNYVRDVALKPLALQKHLGIKQQCDLTASTESGSGTPPPTDTPPPSGSELSYYIRYGDTSIGPADIPGLISFANTNFPGNNVSRIDEVISRSISAGVSPAFTITIWYEEGGFGGAGANSEFGCFPGGDTSQQVSFDAALSCFLNFTSVEHPYDPANPHDSFYEWVDYFCGPNAPSLCSNNPNFINNLQSAYNTVAPGQLVSR